MKKPDLVVWNEEQGYNANLKPYPTSISSPKFELPNVGLIRQESSKKMIDVFERERQEIIDRIQKLHTEYNDSIKVWESKISFEPIIGKEYHLYNFNNQNTLSLIAPNEWNRSESYIGTFMLNSDKKWIRVVTT